ncbi:MAG: hypothetical protein AAF664_23010 [Planctomycetota bacterium]
MNSDNPYRLASKKSYRSSDSNLIRFRWHFPLAILAGLCLTGQPIAWLAVPPTHWPLLALATEYGPWIHPYNLAASLATPFVMPVLQFAKFSFREATTPLRIAQIAIWWIYWLIFGMTQLLGVYRGP